MRNFLKCYRLPIIAGILILLCIFGGFSIGININGTKVEVKMGEPLNIELSNPFPALLNTEDGEEHEELLPTLLSVDNGKPNTDCPDVACGKGAFYPDIDVSSPSAFEESTINRCINTDDWAGAQCWDLIDLLLQYMGDRRLLTGGTGKMKDAWYLSRDENCDPSFCEQITNPEDIIDGDVVFFGTGYYGHGGVARGRYNNGYVALLGQNQGGNKCDGGGSSTNIVNISLRDFIGGYRFKAWNVKPEPTPIVPDGGIVK